MRSRDGGEVVWEVGGMEVGLWFFDVEVMVVFLELVVEFMRVRVNWAGDCLCSEEIEWCGRCVLFCLCSFLD